MSIPKDIVEGVLKQGLGGAPALLGAVADLFALAGHPLDLGPMTPDARRDFKAVDDRIAAKLDERSELDRRHLPEVEHDTDPGPKPSER